MSPLDGRELARLLRKGYADEPWHGPSTSDLLRGLSAEQAAARPVGEAHSAWELVLHMAAWQNEVARRLDGHPAGLPPEGDWPRPPERSENAWQEARDLLATSLDRLCQRVEVLAGADLAQRIGQLGQDNRPLGTGVTKAETILGLLQHNAYHSGQIALIRKALGL